MTTTDEFLGAEHRDRAAGDPSGRARSFAGRVRDRPVDEPVMSHRQIMIVFSGLMLGLLLAALDQSIVSTALPTIVGDFHSLSRLTWVVTAYLLTSTVTRRSTARSRTSTVASASSSSPSSSSSPARCWPASAAAWSSSSPFAPCRGSGRVA